MSMRILLCLQTLATNTFAQQAPRLLPGLSTVEGLMMRASVAAVRAEATAAVTATRSWCATLTSRFRADVALQHNPTPFVFVRTTSTRLPVLIVRDFAPSVSIHNHMENHAPLLQVELSVAKHAPVAGVNLEIHSSAWIFLLSASTFLLWRHLSANDKKASKNEKEGDA